MTHLECEMSHVQFSQAMHARKCVLYNSAWSECGAIRPAGSVKQYECGAADVYFGLCTHTAATQKRGPETSMRAFGAWFEQQGLGHL